MRDRMMKQLRSPRLAVALIAFVVALSLIGTLDFPWAGIVYSGLPFMVGCTLLGVSTAACAWTRAGVALRRWGRAREVTRTAPGVQPPRIAGERLDLVVLDQASAIAALARELNDKRWKVTTSKTVLVAEKGRLGLAGSPLFHWALVALLLVVVLSRLTYSSGFIGIADGSSVIDAKGAYLQLDRGPLAGALSGLTIEVDSHDEHLSIDGVAFPPTPLVRIKDGRTVIAQGAVRANAPLHARGLAVHKGSTGLVADVSLVDADGSVNATSEVPFVFSDETSSGTAPVELKLTSLDGESRVLLVETNARDARGALPRLLPPVRARTLSIKDPGKPSDEGTGVVVPQGSSAPIFAQERLRFDNLRYHAVLSVVRDRGLGLLFAVLAVALAGITVHVMVPYRVVFVRGSGAGEEPGLYCSTYHAHRPSGYSDEMKLKLERSLNSQSGASARESEES